MQLTASQPTGTKVDVPMAPMIDIVFQLLIFFMLNLKILAPEGDFSIHLPQGEAKGENLADVAIKVGLRSDADGNLTQLTIGNRNLGNDEAAFERLNREIQQIVGRPGNPVVGDIEVELDADFETHHRHVVKAISSCTGHRDPQTGAVTRYVERIKFAPPRASRA
ncbi:MAG: biopolymer transporter ExbD [Planctomycetes bacterium]|nr:biopolymer transporter ExbD [Planctomycetota bacterium]